MIAWLQKLLDSIRLWLGKRPTDPPLIPVVDPVVDPEPSADASTWGGEAMIKLPDGGDTLTLTNDQDRESYGNPRRTYAADCLQAAGATVLPTCLCSDLLGDHRYCNPFRSGWGGEINGDFQAWMWRTDNESRFFGSILRVRGILAAPILFASENPDGALSDPAWAEQMVRDMVDFWVTHGSVRTVCIAWHAERFMTPATIKRIAGYVRASMPGERVIVHATAGDYSACGLDGIASDDI